MNTGSVRSRLHILHEIHLHCATSTGQSHKNAPWTPLFTFDPTTPFSESDHEIMSFHCWHCHPSSQFVSSILCTTVGFDQDCNAITRMLLQNNVLKERIGVENQVVEKLDTKDSRLKAIERISGIKFNEMQKQEVNKWKVRLVGLEPRGRYQLQNGHDTAQMERNKFRYPT